MTENEIRLTGQWIKSSSDIADTIPVFRYKWKQSTMIHATLYITTLGVYEAYINGKRVGESVMMPGWTAYEHRIQYQSYDVTSLLQEQNELQVWVGKGWYASPMPGGHLSPDKKDRMERHVGLYAELQITDENGIITCHTTGEDWQWARSQILFSEIYDGERYDARIFPTEWQPVTSFDGPTDKLIVQQGEDIIEHEILFPKEILKTPAGETVIDFGQEITGYVTCTLSAQAGEVIELLHGEVLDQKGNFYNANYREADARYTYICREGEQSAKPRLTFYGFRYVKILQFPGEPHIENFSAIVVHSRLKRTGYITTSHPLLNRLFENVIWGQRGNFLDVPTDCPQRDERLGWTGDARAFIKAACYNYDVRRFFEKWLSDLALEQWHDGSVTEIVPDYYKNGHTSAGWGDAATICPWQIYLHYGNGDIIKNQFHSMKKWVDFITADTKREFLWWGYDHVRIDGIHTRQGHYGDWLGLDAPAGSYMGASRVDFIASAFYARSTELLIKAGQVIGQDMKKYEELYEGVLRVFQQTFPTYNTQTEAALAIYFNLAKDKKSAADRLAELIVLNDGKMATGFIGTPYLNHALSDNGHHKLAFDLILREEYPSWLYSVKKGATTIWEHWDGIMENGDFWSADMNSFNHYAYGAVADWLYEVVGGISPIESHPGFEKVKIAPQVDDRLDFFECSFHSKYGEIFSKWSKEGDKFRHDIRVPVSAFVSIGATEKWVEPGSYTFWN